ncbi:MAG: T9SS type A sorting domain-containing protein [Candidatus Coatesbacteria bacterium]|nr:MAG: T9SS type A sorting domain-containing protein [Candidatus Coatesbacteria bacterium]
MKTGIVFVTALISVLSVVDVYASWDLEDDGDIKFYDGTKHATRGNGNEERDFVFTAVQGPPNLVACEVGEDIYVHAVFFAPPEDSPRHFRIYHSYAKVTGQNGIESDGYFSMCLTDDNIAYFRKFPSITVDGSNDLHVVWEDSRHSDEAGYHWDNYEVYYKKATFSITGGEPMWTWGTEVRITDHTGYSGTPCVACDSIGNAHIVWLDNADDDGYGRGFMDVLYCKVAAFGGVRDMTVLTGNKKGFAGRAPERAVNCGLEQWGNPVVKVDSADNVYVTWMDNRVTVDGNEPDDIYLDKEQRIYLKVGMSGPAGISWSPLHDLSETFVEAANEEVNGWGFTPLNDPDRSVGILLNHGSGGDTKYYEYSTRTSLYSCESFSGFGFSGCSYYLETDVAGGVHAVFNGLTSGGSDRYLQYRYKPYGVSWEDTDVELIEKLDQVVHNEMHFAYFYTPTLAIDADGHLHVLYSKRKCHDVRGGGRFDYGVYYENNWDPVLRMGSPPAPPTDLTADSDTCGKTGSVDLTWTLSINDPEYWNGLTVEPTPVASPGPSAVEVSTPSDVSEASLSSGGISSATGGVPTKKAEGDKPKADAVPSSQIPVGPPDGGTTERVSIVRPDELDVEEYWVIVHYYPGGTEGWTEEYLAGGPGTDKFTIPNVPAGAFSDYSFSVYCKDAVYDSEITGPCAVVATAEAVTDDGASSMAFVRGAVPTSYALYQSVPNPNGGSCSIAYDLPETCRAKITVYDLTGRRIKTVLDTDTDASAHTCTVSGLGAGVYVYRLEAGDFVAARKMVVIK